MRQRQSNRDVRPARSETLDCLALRHVQSITIGRIYLGQRFDQVRDVALITGQTGPDRVRVYGDMQDGPVLPCENLKI